MKKRLWILCMMLIMSVIILIGCGKKVEEDVFEENEKETFQVISTIFPQYDWVKEIIGEEADNYELTLLLDDGVDLHSYQPTVTDIAKISTCDMFIYVGGESDAWVEDALAEVTNKDIIVINLLEVLDDYVKHEEIVEGMESDHDHEEEDADHDHEEEDADHDHEEEDADHDHEEEDADHDHEEEDADYDHEEEDADHDHEEEYDEHVWLSLKNAEVVCQAISQALSQMDEANMNIYQANCDSYVAKLDQLDKNYQEAVEQGAFDTLLFGDRFPFRYLVEDYGLNYYAAFVGCSSETEASFETVVFLAGKVDELGLKNVLVIEKSSQALAETIIDNTTDKNQEIVMLNSMQSVTGEDVANGITYLSIMETNLEALKLALK